MNRAAHSRRVVLAAKLAAAVVPAFVYLVVCFGGGLLLLNACDTPTEHLLAPGLGAAVSVARTLTFIAAATARNGCTDI